MGFDKPATERDDLSSTARSSGPDQYRLLFLLGLRREVEFPDALRHDLQTALRKDNIDQAVIWTAVRADAHVVDALRGMYASSTKAPRGYGRFRHHI